jgi:hypothetical protein
MSFSAWIKAGKDTITEDVPLTKYNAARHIGVRETV